MTGSGDERPGDVRLLAGGDPQIPKGDGDEPVQAYIAAMPGSTRSTTPQFASWVEQAASLPGWDGR